MLDQTQDFLEMLRGLHPGCIFLYFVPVVAILTMAQYPTPAAGAIEFPVHRMNQNDILGTGKNQLTDTSRLSITTGWIPIESSKT